MNCLMARCVAWLQGMRRMREHASTVRANNACRKGRALGRHERELKEKKKRTLFEMARPLRAARARRAPHFPSPRVALALTHGDCGGGYSSPVSLDLKSWTWSCPIAETTTTVTSFFVRGDVGPDARLQGACARCTPTPRRGGHEHDIYLE